MTSSTLPKHVAIILDGNGRWAAARGLARMQGHQHGAQAVRLSVRACRDRGIPYLTLYAFSVANWSRPKDEIDALMRICQEFAEGEHDELIRRGIAVQVVGDLEEIPTPTRRAMEKLVEDTSGGTEMTLALALSYGGRRDMANAMRALAVRARAGLVIPEEINEKSLRNFLTTSSMPDPDLIIRTGGEKRLSDFLLFEAAYAELFFTDTLWPDFAEATFDEALATYARRQRRYGRTGEQVRRLVASS
ncbi:polyprenyl diphosphate synthase [Sorangium sp. So ce590]|uniref:polyprenyl diphosphate synthase n=1 Tax=unclassified Sorangium TaxID=2621164 RepID=UPI003F5DD4B8